MAIFIMSILYIGVFIAMMFGGQLYCLSEVVQMGIAYFIYATSSPKQHSFWTYWMEASVICLVLGVSAIFLGPVGIVIACLGRLVYIYFCGNKTEISNSVNEHCER